MYTDPTTNEIFRSLHRLSSCPEISVYRNQSLRISRKRAYSENCGPVHQSSIMTLTRSLSDGQLSRIDKEKTFKDSGSLFQTKDLLSNVLSALGSIRPINDDARSCLEMQTCYEQEPIDSSYEWTWNRNNSQEINDYSSNQRQPTINSETVTIQDDSHNETKNLNRSFLSKINPFKDRILSQEEGRRYSVSSQEYNVQKYLEKTSNGRESRISFSQLTCENVELLENTSIADLIRAVEETQTKTNASQETPLLGEYKERSKIKIGTVPSTDLRRGSLRPVHTYTTIFVSQNMNNRIKESAVVSRSFPINSTSITAPKRTTRRIRSTSSSIPTVQEHNSLIQSTPMLHRTMSLRPIPHPKNVVKTTVSANPLSEMPMITVQRPNDSIRNLLWHPEYEDKSTLKNKIRRKRADSK